MSLACGMWPLLVVDDLVAFAMFEEQLFFDVDVAL